MISRRWVPLAFVTLLLGGCDIVDGGREVMCTGEMRPGILVAVRDSLTDAPLAPGAELIVRDGTYADTTAFPPNEPAAETQRLAAAYERAGTYTVTVRKAGFVDWVRTGVVVTADECHVQTVSLIARLKHSQ
jgi:hypothetical protein